MRHYLTKKIDYNGTTVTDIFKRFTFLDNFRDGIKFFVEYRVIDGETPEMISHRYYGTPDWWWIILIFNEFQDTFFEWLMTQEEIETYAKKLITDWETNPTDYYAKIEDFITMNETRREIRILKPNYLDTVVKNLKGWT